MNTQTPRTAAEAVANGAQWLDDMHPGWWRAIDLDVLNLASCKHCVCGQLARTAYATSEAKDHYRTMLKQFYPHYGFDFGLPFWDYPELEEEWHKVITARLEADALPTHEKTKVAVLQ